VLEPLPLGKSLRSLLGILLGSEFGDETRAHVFADDAVVHLATASVVPT